MPGQEVSRDISVLDYEDGVARNEIMAEMGSNEQFKEHSTLRYVEPFTQRASLANLELADPIEMMEYGPDSI
jgi:hypothetical protein